MVGFFDGDPVGGVIVYAVISFLCGRLPILGLVELHRSQWGLLDQCGGRSGSGVMNSTPRPATGDGPNYLEATRVRIRGPRGLHHSPTAYCFFNYCLQFFLFVTSYLSFVDSHRSVASS